MYLISAEGYKKADKTDEIWPIMHDAGSGMGVKNISDVVLKEVYDIFETRNPTKERISKCKMTEREIYGKFDNLSEEELNRKSNKNIYLKIIS